MKAGLWTEDFTARSGVSLDSWRREMSVLLSTAWHRPRKIGLFSGQFIRELGRIYDLFDSLYCSRYGGILKVVQKGARSPTLEVAQTPKQEDHHDSQCQGYRADL